MSQSFSRVYKQLGDWAQQAEQAGWISQKDYSELQKVETQQAEALFSASGQRPLIVAFFGGTGVGKSSLLNRLAGRNIAKTGVERPTSREVTLFLHRDFEVRDLPAELPQEDTVISYHDDDNRRLVAWLDLPDIDSTASSHREQVEQWLPYIDWVVYVVSPERYHDDIGWRFLQQRQQHHSWLFIMNHWDEGRIEQREDFRLRLTSEGFSEPTIITTDCGPNSVEDEFHTLEDTINRNIRKFGLGFLQSMIGKARLNELKEVADSFKNKLGSEAQWSKLESTWTRTTEQQLQHFCQRLSSSTVSATQLLITKEQSENSLFKRNRASANDLALPTHDLSNQLSSMRNTEFGNELGLSLNQNIRAESVPTMPFGQPLEKWVANLQPALKTALNDSADNAALNPGTPSSRFFYTLTKTLAWFLPLAAAGWVVFHVINSFYLGTQGIQEFLGLNFVTHSMLLIGMAWLIPWILQRQLRPSLAKSLRKGLLNGIVIAKGKLQNSLNALLGEIRAENQQQMELLQSATRLLDQAESETTKAS